MRVNLLKKPEDIYKGSKVEGQNGAI